MAGFDSAQDKLVTVFGGAGFLGRHTVRALADRGWRVRVASRRPDLAFHVQPQGRVGQVSMVQANLRYPTSVLAAMTGSHAVVNLVGILAEHGRQNFEAVHSFGARAIARAALEHGITNVVQVSAIGADAESPSIYARSKARAEAAVREAIPQAIIVRPSILFGPEDTFFNRFGALARMTPVLPLIGGGHTRMQPVYVADVADAIAQAVSGEAKPGTTYEFGGPAVQSFKELMEFVCAATHRRRLLVPVPFGVARIPAFAMEIANGLLLGALPSTMLITRDQVELLKSDNVVSEAATAEGRTLQGLGLVPRAFESIAPSYLYRFRKTGQFDRGRIA